MSWGRVVADRRAQIILLLQSQFDFDFQPETFTGKVVRRGATAGKGSPSHWQPCPRCNGSGSVKSYNKLVDCDTCQGAGRRRVDDYTNEVVVTDEARDVPLGELIRRDTKHVKCPDCQDLAGTATGVIRGAPCRRCGGTGSAPVAGSWLSAPLGKDQRTGGDALDAMLDAIERRRELGDWDALEKAKAGIVHHVNKPLRFAALTLNAVDAVRLLDEVYVLGERDQTTLTRFEEALIELALAYIESRMPDPIRVPRDILRNAEERAKAAVAKGQALNGLSRERRDKLIRQWDRQGKPRQWIGQQTGLSDRQLREIINGKGVAA